MSEENKPDVGAIMKTAMKEALSEFSEEQKKAAEEAAKEKEPPPERTEKPNNVWSSLFGG